MRLSQKSCGIMFTRKTEVHAGSRGKDTDPTSQCEKCRGHSISKACGMGAIVLKQSQHAKNKKINTNIAGWLWHH